MLIQATTDGAAPDHPGLAARRPRRVLLAAAALALAVGVVAGLRGEGAGIDPDLVRVLRFMAAMKGVFAAAAFAACYWRLARPAAPWRRAVYVLGPPLMIGGACGLWALRDLGAAAFGLHVGLFAVLAAALTDPDFLPPLKLPNGRGLRGKPPVEGGTTEGIRRSDPARAGA